jgi:DNA polymerase-3 subunit alpha (Gram-positive type)
MPGKYLLNINDSGTKEILKAFFTPENAAKIAQNLIFKSIEFPEDGPGPMVISAHIHDLGAAPAFYEIVPRLMGSASGREVKYSLEFSKEVDPAQAIRSFWTVYKGLFEAEKVWLDFASAGVENNGLVIKCSNDLAFSRLSEKKIIMALREKALAFTGRHVEIAVTRDQAPAPAQDARPVVTSVQITSSSIASSKVLKEDDIPGEATRIEDITTKGKYVIEGRVFITDDADYWRDMKGKGRDGSDSRIIFFYMTDDNDTIKLSCWLDYEDGLFEAIKKIKYARAFIEADYYPNEIEMTGRVKKLKLIPAPEVLDCAPQKRVELHAHTQMSAMDALTSVTDFINRASRWGHPAVAITDHGVVHAYPEAYALVNDRKNPLPNPIKLILGMEGYLVHDDTKIDRKKSKKDDDDKGARKEKPFHIIILVKNKTGLKNLYKLVSFAHLDYFYKKPRIPKKVLEANREGLIIGTACYIGELYQAILAKKSDEELEAIAASYDYLEIQPDENNRFLVRSGELSSEEELHEINRKICALGESLGKPVVATGDVHFLDPQDRIYREVLMSAQGFDEIGEGATADLSFKTTDWMLKEFSYLGAEKALEVVVKNTCLIAGMIDQKIMPVPDKLFPPTLDNSEDEISRTSWDRAAEIYGVNLPDIVSERVDRELKAIIGNKFAVLYLIAKKMVEKSNSDGYIVGSRGSVGSSIVAFLCGISEVNPLAPHYICKGCQHSEFLNSDLVGIDLEDKECPVCGQKMDKDGYNIPFETFMGFKGDKVPDIDLNFSGEYQDKIHKFIIELFGADKVFRAGTIGTVQDKTVRKEYIPKYEERTRKKIKEAEKERLIKGCIGVKRTTGQHAGGLMLVPRDCDIYDFTPIQNPPQDKETITTHFDFNRIHDTLVKIDALGHDLPTSLKRICNDLNINVNDIPIDDRDTMKLFSGVSVLKVDPKNYSPAIGTLGVPEYGTKFTREMLAMTKPKTFSELIYIAGLSHGTLVWRGNAEELIKNKTATLKEVISVRDDIMNFLISKGLAKDISFQITESVRKGRGLIPEWEELMKKHKVPDWYILSCKKIKYMFPKAHAVAYAIMAFRIAYMKVHQPLYFYADYYNRDKAGFEYDFASMDLKKLAHARRELELKFRNEKGKKEESQLKVVEVMFEMKERGFEFMNVDIYRSDPHIFRVQDSKILMPLTIIPDLGEKVADAIAAERIKSRFKSMEDMVKRTKVNKNVIEFLNTRGIAETIPATDQTVMF